jgi:hypothetical protein
LIIKVIIVNFNSLSKTTISKSVQTYVNKTITNKPKRKEISMNRNPINNYWKL